MSGGADTPPRKGGVWGEVERVDASTVQSNPRFAEARPHRCNDSLSAVFDRLGDSACSWAEWRASVRDFVQCLKQ